MFSLFHERPRSLKEAITLGRRRIYDEFWALQDVSFEVEPGETFGLIGANGSGKSTLLKCLCRILTPDRGTIAVDGRVGALLELGAGFHPELTGRENVFLNGAILGASRRELKARFDEIVALAGLERFIDTRVKNYSSGMYARLGFAIAVSLRPDVLLVDEVLAVGDEEFQRRSMAKFDELRKGGATLVLVTHALDIVAERCERAAFLRDGRVVEIGGAAKVVAAYRKGVAGPPAPDVASVRRAPEITRVELRDARSGSSVRAGRPIELVVDWAAPAAAQDVEIDVGLTRGDLEVAGEITGHAAGVKALTSPGGGRARIRLSEGLLVPGDYLVRVAVRAAGEREAAGPVSVYALVVEAETSEAPAERLSGVAEIGPER
jgi:ABC-2 type transport system ATP-binding protein